MLLLLIGAQLVKKEFGLRLLLDSENLEGVFASCDVVCGFCPALGRIKIYQPLGRRLKSQVSLNLSDWRGVNDFPLVFSPSKDCLAFAEDDCSDFNFTCAVWLHKNAVC